MCSLLLNIIGLIIGLIGTIFLIQFGVTFRGNKAGVNISKQWTRIGFTMERGERLGFILLSVGFILQLIAQIF